MRHKMQHCAFWALLGGVVAFVGGCSNQSDDYIGYISADYVYLSAAVSGILEQLNVNRGESVAAKQLLFELNEMPEQQGLVAKTNQVAQQQEKLEDMMQAERDPIIQKNQSQLKQAEVKRDLARKTFSRSQRLYQNHAISAEKYDTDRSQFKAQQQVVQQARATLINSQLASRAHQIKAQRYGVFAAKAQENQARWQLNQKLGVAPVNGRVFDIYYRPGEFVASGHPILSILAPQYMFVDFYVNEKSLSSLKIGQKIQFTCDGCQANNSATLSYISPKAEFTPPVIYSNETRSKLVYEVRAKLPLKTALQFHPGQPVQIMKTTTR